MLGQRATLLLLAAETVEEVLLEEPDVELVPLVDEEAKEEVLVEDPDAELVALVDDEMEEEEEPATIRLAASALVLDFRVPILLFR